MAQSAAMGPPLSPRETRRSGRRSAPSASASTSKSPDSPASESAPRNKENGTRHSLSTSSSNGRTKRMKQEDLDDPVPHKNAHPNGAAVSHGNSNGRTKRKGKDKDKNLTATDIIIEAASNKLDNSTARGTIESPEDDAEQGVTRCICGLNDEDAAGGEFMVQCETCNVWQHGLCMGYLREDQLQDDYHCEKCKPERHQDLFKRLSKKARQSSTNSQHTSAAAASRLSRSHSPSHLLKPPKRRNTMNSRDAAFDESLKELMEATAAEAATVPESTNGDTTAIEGMSIEVQSLQEEVETELSGRKKRKRTEDESIPKKRTRSTSSASDHPIAAPPIAPAVPLAPPPPPEEPPASSSKRNVGLGNITKSVGSRNRRSGGRKSAVTPQESMMPGEGDEVPGPSNNTNSTKRSTQSVRGKITPASKRPPPSSHASGSGTHEHGTRRNHVIGGTAAGASAENSRAYRNSHAYAISQQPLFTSWNLPDYLAHLEPMLPTNIPRPIEVRGSGIKPGPGRESMERTTERGVKVKWPSKRMSVGDMNKRVRALVEWVGREQAGAMDRGRRRDALEKALKDLGELGRSADISTHNVPSSAAEGGEGGSPMILDHEDNIASKLQDMRIPSAPADGGSNPTDHKAPSSTMKMMEELMEELINFQERFGPSMKRERERRPAS
ncbi:hypothetical protein BJ138DRAFT_1080223 [Hygrophoropsis aurantiaca]|uniref:Uncharacterized protein n=1 Tax=Hygrophoropsis aurantiaca TaxID=72124 RepID=A0ACB8AL89_9AGAM|nr:hypothetical protein BJ138DRAFT_1080223 [Hygrophoropsis aurantiaca]